MYKANKAFTIFGEKFERLRLKRRELNEGIINMEPNYDFGSNLSLE